MSKASELVAHLTRQDIALPYGTVGMTLPGLAIPAGCLELNGQIVTSAYPKLHADLITAGSPYGSDTNGNPFLLDVGSPSGNGIFMRLVHSGMTSRLPGTYEEDAFQGHKHFSDWLTHASGAGSRIGTGVLADAQISPNAGLDDAGYGTPRIDDETRPENVAFIAWVKAADDVQNAELLDASQLSTDIANVAIDLASRQRAIGDDQTWQDVSASRANNTIYTNSTDRTIAVSVWALGAPSPYISFYVNDIQIGFGGNSWTSSNQSDGVFFLVPANATYKITLSTGSILGWQELR